MVASTGAVLRYKFNRSHKNIRVHKGFWRATVRVQVRELVEFVMVAASAKTMTNNLPILSVLATGMFTLINQSAYYFRNNNE
jgi:hypothetical protein